jgi:hypothetical protein
LGGSMQPSAPRSFFRGEASGGPTKTRCPDLDPPLPRDTAWAMSEENVEIVRDALDAFGAADVERLLQFMDPEIKFEPHLALLEGNYRGHDGVREFMADAS